MTDKEQIIINGVDVSQCNFLCTDGTCACAFTDLLCKHKEKIEKYCLYSHNCYFKQLARMTQKYNLLVKTNKQHVNLLDQLNNKYINLEQEYEELKYENQKLEMQLCNNCGEKDDYNIPCKMIRDLNYCLQKEIDENDRYHEALEEVEKAIATYSSRHQFSIANDLYNQILDIINKAKDINVPHKKEGK